MSVHLFQVFQVDVAFACPVVPSEDGRNILLVFIVLWFCLHSLHEVSKTYASRLLNIELSHDFVNRLLVWLEAVLLQK